MNEFDRLDADGDNLIDLDEFLRFRESSILKEAFDAVFEPVHDRLVFAL